jgi:hypothetical protein
MTIRPPGSTQTGNEITITTTGNIDDLDFGNASLIRMNNATLATIRGLKAGYSGQKVAIISINAEVDFAHQNANSSANNRLINYVTSGVTPIINGNTTYQYDSDTGRWRLINHEQGDWITPAFSAGVFAGTGSMTWTVSSADRRQFQFKVAGKELFLAFNISGTIGGVVNSTIIMTIPNSYTCPTAAADQQITFIFVSDNGVRGSGFTGSGVISSTTIELVKQDGTAWTLSAADATLVAGIACCPLV